MPRGRGGWRRGGGRMGDGHERLGRHGRDGGRAATADVAAAAANVLHQIFLAPSLASRRLRLPLAPALPPPPPPARAATHCVVDAA